MVLIFQRNVAFVHGNEPVIGYGNAKDVTGEVLQDGVLTCPIGLAVRAPLPVLRKNSNLFDSNALCKLHEYRFTMNSTAIQGGMQH